ncbi:pyridoxamine 5'-phosphate oxidase family protein [Cytobacillus sp. Hz8]|uniref:pyridoxamine 5'-phosphate oxidase family protein n=1 Tax=Cytobacillus sp. Hz8 TaxID=3347168 RepID=UPI0035D86021
MRQETLEWNSELEINRFLAKTKTGYLGLVDGEEPYVIPLNFVWHHNTIYFHGASEGRKMDVLKKNNHACFTVSLDLGTMTNPVPAKTDTAYHSVLIFGQVEQIDNLDEATAAMQLLLDKYVPGYYQQPLAKTHIEKYRSPLGSETKILKIPCKKLTAKKNELNPAIEFYHGRTVSND